MPADTTFQQLKRLGVEIREHREKLGLSQEAFAERAGVHANYVGRLELGKQNVSFEYLVKIARGCSVKHDTVKVWHLLARADI